MSFREMPLEEKYDKLLDLYVQTEIVNYNLHKELGTVDKRNDMMFKVWKNLLPSYMGMALQVMKTIAPGTTFKKVVDSLISFSQVTVPLSNIEVTFVSEREVVIKTKNCPMLIRGKELAKKAGLDIDPKEICKNEQTYMPKMVAEWGIDITMKLEEDGCQMIGKLK